MSDFKWSDVSPYPSLTQAPTREEQVAIDRERQRARLNLELAVGSTMPAQAVGSTAFPELGAMTGGLLGMSAKSTPFMSSLVRNVPKPAQPFVPSLVGSSIGSVLGTVGEQAALGQGMLTSETGRKILGNLIENAAFDVGGNLVFSVGGKIVNATKEQLERAGVKKGLFDTPEGQARKAAQEFLSNQGATLTRSQLTGSPMAAQTEAFLRPVSSEFSKQQKNVLEALGKGARSLMDTLETSESFKQALKTADTPGIAQGDTFHKIASAAEQAMKEKVRPVYDKISKEHAIQVDVRPQKEAALAEWEAHKRINFKGLAPEKKALLEGIISQSDFISIADAHLLRSNFLTSARDVVKEGSPMTSLVAEYKKQAQGLENAMHSASLSSLGTPQEIELAKQMGLIKEIAKDSGLPKFDWKEHNLTSLEKLSEKQNQTLRDYWSANTTYREGMTGLYGGSIGAALKEEPSSVGRSLFNIDNPERLRDVFKAVVVMERHLPKEQSKGIIGDLQYGFLNEMFGKAGGIEEFGKKMKDIPGMGTSSFKQSFDYLFKDAKLREQLKAVANASQQGIADEGGIRTLLATTARYGIATGAGTVSFLTLSDDIQDRIKENLGETALTAGMLLLTPRLLAKAATDKEAMDALAGLAKAQSNPKYGGAMAAKIADGLNKLIDGPYRLDVERLLKPAPETAEQTQPTSVEAPIPQTKDFDWNQVAP